MTDEDVTADQENALDEQQEEQTEESPEEEQQEEPSAEEQQEELSEEEQAMAKLKEAIIVEREEIGPLRMKLTITVPRDTLDERMGEQFAELKRDADVPGFRKGHAPMRLVEKRFGTDVGNDLVGKLLGSGYLAAVEKEELKTLGDPLFWVKVKEERTGEDLKTKTVETEKLLPFGKALDTLKMPKEGALSFVCEVEIKPQFELPELDKIPVTSLTIKVDDDGVEAELKRLRMTRGTYVPVEEGEVEPDDLLYADMKMSVDGNVIETEENFDLAARDVRVKGVVLTGFGEAVVGKKVDEQFTFGATVPDDHENIDIRGKRAEFELTIREIKRFEVPPVDEDLLSTLGASSEDELRDTIRFNLEAGLDTLLERGMREQIGTYLIENTAIEISESLSQRQTERTIARRMMEMLQAGAPEAEISKSMDEMRASARDQVVRDLKLYFILEKIADEWNVEVPEERVNAAIAEIARQSNKRFDRVRDELSKGDGLTTLYLQLRDRHVLDALLAGAEITETELPKKESPKKKAAGRPEAEKETKKQ